MPSDPLYRRNQLNLRVDDEIWARLLDMQKRLGVSQIGMFARPIFEERIREVHQMMPAYSDELDRSSLYEEPKQADWQTRLPVDKEAV